METTKTTKTETKATLFRILIDGEQVWSGATEDAMLRAYDDMGYSEEDDGGDEVVLEHRDSPTSVWAFWF